MKLAIAFAVVALLATCSVPQTPKASMTATPINEWSSVPLAPNVSCNGMCNGYSVQPYVRTRSRYGIGCMGNVPPGQHIPADLPPQSYLAADVGKPGFPTLTSRQMRSLKRFVHPVNAKTLRISWVAEYSGENGFIVFDATDGPCEVWAGGYSVLNGTCNEFYQPGENPYGSHAGSGCYPNDPRPATLPSPKP